jgi:DNA (cytosine-5)-methyltransferase 1
MTRGPVPPIEQLDLPLPHETGSFVSLTENPRYGISLFSSAGLGELGMVENGIEILVANELLADRCALYEENYPTTEMFRGDVWALKDRIIEATRRKLGGEELFIAYATPPCQGMSTNGAGKLKAEVAAGTREEEDARNRLIIPAMDVVCALRPRWVLLENVPGMQYTEIRTDHGQCQILDYVKARLGSDYVGGGEVVSCADFGIPQLRRRLITIFTRDSDGKRYYESNRRSFFPPYEREKPLTLRDAISGLPPLDAVEGRNAAPWFHPLHRVGVMKPEKYWWVSNTPEGDTAFNNQCVEPTCRFDGNARHFDVLEDGQWRSSKTTPLYCAKCGSLLPRPSLEDKATGERRLIRGFHSAYRRMEWDKPSRALTSNFPFEASDNKIHPSQNRVLSTYEALVIQTIAKYSYRWISEGKEASKTLIAHAIGESVPPLLIDLIVKKFVKLSSCASEGRLAG